MGEKNDKGLIGGKAANNVGKGHEHNQTDLTKNLKTHLKPK